MPIINLPEDISTTDNKSDSIIFHNYAARVGTFNGKSILNRNAISLVISGEKTMQFAEKSVTVNDNEFHFLSEGNCLVTMKLAEKKTFKSILIFFDNKVLNDFYLKYDKRITELKRKTKIAPESYIAFRKDAFVLHFIASLNLLFQSKSIISKEIKQVKFEELMLHLLETHPHKLLSFQTSNTKDLDDFKIRKVVETNLTKSISLEELAFLCNLSLSTFKRRFIKIYNTPPNKWMLRKRMELAKELLLHHKEKPSEVFYKVGYSNHSSFTQSFKQLFGTTPKEFQLNN